MAYLITAEYFQEQMATLGLKATFAPSAYNLTTLITEASDWVEGYTDRKFELQTVTEEKYGPVRSDRRFLADNYPVVSVTSAYWEDEAGSTGVYDVSQFRVRTGGIIEWKTLGNLTGEYAGMFHRDVYYSLTYQTGYATVPSNVQRATALKIATLLQPQYQGPQEREIFMTTNLDAMIVDLLEPFRRERFG
jgi:hypothetical protein